MSGGTKHTFNRKIAEHVSESIYHRILHALESTSLITKYEGMIYNVADNIGFIANCQLKNQQYLIDQDIFTPENNAISREFCAIKGLSKQIPETILPSLSINVSQNGKDTYVNIPIESYLNQTSSELFHDIPRSFYESAFQKSILVIDYSTYAVNSLIAASWNIAHSYLDYPAHSIETALENVENYLYDVYENYKFNDEEKHTTKEEVVQSDICLMEEKINPINNETKESETEIIPKEDNVNKQDSKYKREK